MVNLQSILITNGIGITIVVLTWINSHRARQDKALDYRLLTWMLCLIATGCLSEGLSYLIEGKSFPGARFLVILFNTWLYLCNIGFSTLWCLYVDYHLYRSQTRLRRSFVPMFITTLILWLIILGNLFGHYLFIITEDNVYERLPAAYVFFALPIAYIGVSAADVYQYNRKYSGANFFPIWAFLAPFLLGCAIQALFYGISVAWCCVGIAVSTVYISLQNELVYLDPLTKLYNRNYLNYILQSHRWGRTGQHSGIMIDVDEFKTINDSYGHSSGDLALCDTAQIIRDSIPDSAVPVRFAGDEFIVLMQTGDQDEAEKVVQNIREGVERFNLEKQRPFTLSLSMGTAIYQAGKTSQDAFLDEIDRRMYEDKRCKYENGELKERRNIQANLTEAR